jgi:hypothetical protein
VVDVDALVALQAHELGARRLRERAGHLRLADPGLALEQERLLELVGEEHRGGQRPVGQVRAAGERLADRVDRVQPWSGRGQLPAAVVSARLVRACARCRL